MTHEFANRRPRVDPTAWVAPGAHLIGDVVVEAEASVWFNAVLRGDIEPVRVGRGSNVQDNAVVHTDSGFPAEIGRDVTVGHGAIIHGAIIEDGALIGMGAIILTGARVGAGAIVGAGALVPEGKEVPPGWLALGVPARPVRELSAGERERTAANTAGYVRRKDEYRQSGA